jgi:hypothetical protein
MNSRRYEQGSDYCLSKYWLTGDLMSFSFGKKQDAYFGDAKASYGSTLVFRSVSISLQQHDPQIETSNSPCRPQLGVFVILETK